MKVTTQLIVGGLFEERMKIAKKLIRPFFKKPLDLDNPPVDLLVIKAANSIGISQIRALKKFLFLKPYQEKRKIGLVPEAEKLTLPAQNSLLKTLEEPPENSLIILLASHSTSLLPTIISRAEITRLPARSQIDLSPQESQQLHQTLKKLLTLGVGERIALSLVLVKNKDHALVLTENLLFLWRQFLLIKTGVEKKGPSFQKKLSIMQIKKGLKNTEQVRKMLKTNVNFHLAMENLFLSYPQIS